MRTFIFAIGMYVIVGSISEILFRRLIFFVSKNARQSVYIDSDGKEVDMTDKGIDLDELEPIRIIDIPKNIILGPFHLLKLIVFFDTVLIWIVKYYREDK